MAEALNRNRLVELADRLEFFYSFECLGGTLGACIEWIELRRGFVAQGQSLDEANRRAADVLPHGDLCRLSQIFEARSAYDEQDRRISDWLKRRIAEARR